MTDLSQEKKPVSNDDGSLEHKIKEALTAGKEKLKNPAPSDPLSSSSLSPEDLAHKELMEAIREGSHQKVRYILQNSKITDINFQYKFQGMAYIHTPLSLALRHDPKNENIKKIITELITAGADCQSDKTAHTISGLLDESLDDVHTRALLCFCIKNMNFDPYKKYQAIFGFNCCFFDKVFCHYLEHPGFYDLIKDLLETGKFDPKKEVRYKESTELPIKHLDWLQYWNSGAATKLSKLLTVRSDAKAAPSSSTSRFLSPPKSKEKSMADPAKQTPDQSLTKDNQSCVLQ